MVPFKMNKIHWALVSAALLVVVAAADYFSSAELRFSVFYYMPIALLAWYVSRETAFAAAVVAGIIWWIVEVSTVSYTSHLFAAGNFAIRLVAFALVSVAIARLRSARDREQQLNAALEATVDKLEKSMAEINELRDKMQFVCAWTNRIQSEGRWVPIDRFLADKLHLKISHGISEEAVEKFFSQVPRHRSPDGGGAEDASDAAAGLS